MEVVNPQGDTPTKQDDFFDEDHSKQNGELPAGMQEIAAKEETGKDGDDVKEGGDDVTKVEDKADGEEQDPDAVAASGGEGGDGAPAALSEEQADSQPTEASPEEQVDDGFKSTSPAPTSETAPSQPDEEPAGHDSQSPEENAVEAEQAVTPSTEAEKAELEEAEVDQKVTTESEEDGQAPEEEARTESQGDAHVNGTEPEEEATPKASEAGKEEEEVHHDYDDSFSDCSQKSLASVDSTGKTMNPKIEVETPASEAGENETAAMNGDGEPAGSIKSASPVPPSPTPSDSRAEAGAVVPVAEEAGDDQKRDGRSSADQKETGEYRGEDRNEVNPPEGTEDSRGQGQWKSEEQQYFASAVLAQKSEQEAMRELEDERDRLLVDHHAMKTSLETLEGEVERKGDLLVAEKEINASKEKKIKELQEELDLLNSKNPVGSEERIKDLQERLAVLARENEEKDQQIHRLSEELKARTIQLKETERRLAIAEEANASNPEAPKSKTCAIM